MITELSKYIKGISEQFPLSDFQQPSEGLHIMVEVEGDYANVSNSELYKASKSHNPSDFLRNECLPREMNIAYINSNKAIADKRIHSASPFAIKFKKQILSTEEWLKWLTDDFSSNSYEIPISIKDKWQNSFGTQKPKPDKYKIFLKDLDKSALRDIQRFMGHCVKEQFSEVVNYYWAGTREKCQSPRGIDADVVQRFHEFCSNFLLTYILDDNSYYELSSGNYIIVYLKNAEPEAYSYSQQPYLENGLFNKSDYNQHVKGQVFGLSDFLNGDNQKKPYLKHKTAPFDVNYRISGDTAKWLHTFKQYKSADALKTNPLAIFISKEELNGEVVNIVKREGVAISFHRLIQELYKNRTQDLSNYYLLYFQGKDLSDLDFVSSFQFSVEAQVFDVIDAGVNTPTINNIFNFEHEVIPVIFNNQLVQRRKDKPFAYRYFDEIKNDPKYITETMWNLIIRYRKAFYDFIYKSRRQAVSSHMFHDIMWQGIIDDLRHDEVEPKYDFPFTKKYNQLKGKLNIWLSLWNFFSSKSENTIDMPGRIKGLQDRMRAVREIKDDEHLFADEEFAFAVGQVVYFLLSKSKSGNRTHGLLEPFIQKSDVGELKKTITGTFNAYKHEISFGQGRFEKLCGEVMGYEPEKPLKELAPIILAGYFSPSSIYEKSIEKPGNDE